MTYQNSIWKNKKIYFL